MSRHPPREARGRPPRHVRAARGGVGLLVPRVLLVALLVLSACSQDSPSTLDPEGAGARRISSLWWLMFGLGLLVYVVVAALIVASWNRRRSLAVNRFVLVGGVVLPALVLAVVGVETVRATNDVFEETGEEGEADVVVVGEQWWWRVRYPDAGVETANEVHIPAGQPVTVELRSADVVHSFWLPQLAGKIDMVPGQSNQLVLEADRPGSYRGVCGEYCGAQHGNMRFLVVAHQPAEFEAWLEARRGAPGPPSGQAAEGERVFQEEACAGCHTVDGTPARGTLGPDLTDFGARRELGAGVVENDPGPLAQWVRDARELKPSALMPPIDLSDEETEALVAYLESLDPE